MLNARHAKELILELCLLCLLSFSIHAQQCSVEGGHVNEMIQAPVNKFQTLNNQAIQNIVTPMQNVQLLDSEDIFGAL